MQLVELLLTTGNESALKIIKKHKNFFVKLQSAFW